MRERRKSLCPSTLSEKLYLAIQESHTSKRVDDIRARSEIRQELECILALVRPNACMPRYCSQGVGQMTSNSFADLRPDNSLRNDAHYAVVDGINHYQPPLGALSGAIADAVAFGRWLTRTDGGASTPRASGRCRPQQNPPSLSKRLGAIMQSEEKEQKQASPETEEPNKALPPAAVYAALGVLLFFGALVIFMLARSNVDDVTWQRQVYVYGSVEAIVFAAAGALFGVQIKRQEAKAADERASESAAEAKEAKVSERIAADQAQKGRTIAATARGLAAASGRQSTDEPTASTESTPGRRGATPGNATTQAAALDALVHVADELFPRD